VPEGLRTNPAASPLAAAGGAGASGGSNAAMTHIAIQESLDGKTVEWLEKVTDEQYQGKT
jgi:hypothetical protein